MLSRDGARASMGCISACWNPHTVVRQAGMNVWASVWQDKNAACRKVDLTCVAVRAV